MSLSMSDRSKGMAFMSTRPLTEIVTDPETDPYRRFCPSHRLITSARGPYVHPKMHWHSVTLTRSSRPCSLTVLSRPSNNSYPLTPGKAGCPHTLGSTQTIMLTSWSKVCVHRAPRETIREKGISTRTLLWRHSQLRAARAGRSGCRLRLSESPNLLSYRGDNESIFRESLRRSSRTGPAWAA